MRGKHRINRIRKEGRPIKQLVIYLSIGIISSVETAIAAACHGRNQLKICAVLPKAWACLSGFNSCRSLFNLCDVH